MFEESFNTSHVTLYLSGKRWCRCRIPSFNTSHVTLYPISGKAIALDKTFQYITCYSLSHTQKDLSAEKQVSIHHMLLFINEWRSTMNMAPMFQYITCYSLSLHR